MTESNQRKVLIVAYFLSKYDRRALEVLNYNTFTSAFKDVGTRLGIKPNTVKNRRDDFDSLHDNGRSGWYQKELSKSSLEIVDEFKDTSEAELAAIVKEIIYGPIENNYVREKELRHDINKQDINKEDLLKLLLSNITRKLNVFKLLSTEESILVTKVDEKGLYVETETFRQNYELGESEYPWELLSFELLYLSWDQFIKNRAITTNDLTSKDQIASIILSFFAVLPFVIVKEKPSIMLSFKRFKTNELPTEQINKVIFFLEEIVNETYLPEKLSNEIEGNQYRIKSRSRQDLRLLGFLDESNKRNESAIQKYIQSTNKLAVLKELMLQKDYFKMCLTVLEVLHRESKRTKKNVLVKLGMLIVENSRGENYMVESVATERTQNLLMWLHHVNLIDDSWDLINQNNNAYKISKKDVEIVVEEKGIFLSSPEVINHIHSYITSKGFYYEKEEVTNFFYSLKTKPFVILSGISGTGKTKIVQWFAESVGATEENGQFALIPVRPDWSDGSDLLGYTDIKGEFKEGPLTTVLKKAIDEPERPYFVLLDEMNLARVEHYFSDLLSVMESRKWEEDRLVTSTVLTEELAGKDIYLPANVYIIGTVNMDETTHPFSKKVLDRANTLEFNRVKLDNLQFLLDREEMDPVVLHNNVFATKYLHLKDVYSAYPKLVEEVTSVLVEINNVLQINGSHVGYRVRDEICFYLAYNEESNLMEQKTALDHCILQKILPRLAGSDTRIERVLKALFKLFTNKEIEYAQDATLEDVTYAVYPKSAEKVLEMIRRLEDDGFTSFWISS
ncbi:5-methylcytosine-specific restriction related enzyme [Halalkalibacter wakoensis JCM 9140]|uniref:5-methylcytosine-specific restriction related enzyme n=1 Tax=Halalkalibacter wakoensis JCM 9140 TaxID=1236970 RepID=W4Q6W8_9BACI|nr:5-methylcytosine-specific restriction related enzyme [Halalkalibacter wakoensis JCM 9140]